MKKVAGSLKLLCEAGKASPAPPIGPALGQKGVNIMEFCKAFNAETEKKEGLLPVVVTVYEDRSFSFQVKTPPVSYLIKQAANIKKGSQTTPIVKVGKISWIDKSENIKSTAGVVVVTIILGVILLLIDLLFSKITELFLGGY